MLFYDGKNDLLLTVLTYDVDTLCFVERYRAYYSLDWAQEFNPSRLHHK